MQASSLALVSTLFRAVGSQMEGAAADQSASYQAKQLDQRAGQTRAASQRAAAEERRRAALVNSRLQAVAGGGGLDPTVAKLSADIAGEGEYRALSSLYEGEERARGDEMAAAGKRYDGRQSRRAGNIGAVSSLFSGGSTLYQKYGGAN